MSKMRVNWGRGLAVLLTLLLSCLLLVSFREQLMNQLIEETRRLSGESIKRAAPDGEDHMRYLRSLDKNLASVLMNLNVESMSEEEALPFFYEFVSKPKQGVCRILKRLGGVWIAAYKAVDGDKFICLDKILSLNSNCTVYSFGINNEWSFEDQIVNLGCHVYAFDHTINADKSRGNYISYFHLGVATSTGDNKDTLHNILAMNNHTNTTISYLKVDVEGEELSSLPQWIEDGTMNQVEQLAMEFHTGTLHQPPRFRWLLGIFKALYRLGFRIVSYEVNMTAGKAEGGYYSFFEILLVKDDIWSYLDTPISQTR